MAITAVKDLLPLLGSVAATDDPIAALERQGHTFGSDLKSRLRPRRSPPPALLARWKRDAAKAGRLSFTAGVRRPQAARRALAPGEYEFSAGLRFPIANEILAGVHASGTIPEVLFLDQLLSAGDIDVLQGLFVVDRPGGRIGRLQLTAPSTIASIGDGADRVAMTFPFRLNFERVTTVLGRQVRTVVTVATGRLRLIVGLITRPVTVRGAKHLEIQVDLATATGARLEIDANSPVQRASQPGPGQPDVVAEALQGAIRQRLAGFLQVTVSAAIPVPIGTLTIRETAVVTRGDALLVGVRVDGTEGPGNPALLARHFPNAQANFFSRMHDEIPRLIVQQAARSGQLTQIARQTHPDAVIESADVVFGPGVIQLTARGKIVDLCPLNVDLGFTTTTTLTLTLEGTRIRVRKETSDDLDNTDAVLCAITSLGLALLAAVVVILSQGLSLGAGLSAGYALGVVGALTLMLEFDSEDFDLVLGGGTDGATTTLIDLDVPFPGTDLLPTLNGLFVRLDDSTMLMAGRLATRPDVLNTYFYMRFLEADTLGVARAMTGAVVRLIDRDAPPPAGDDVTFPGPTTTTSTQSGPAGDFLVTKRTRFERSADETVRQATTDHAGRVRIFIPRDQLASKAGHKVVETTRLNLDTDQETRTTTRTAVPEARPDFYFRLTRTNGTSIDTLPLPAGLLTNFESARIGTPANPLTIAFGSPANGGGGVVVFDPS